MNPDYMCIEEGPNPLLFHGKFEADFWESVSQLNTTVNTHFGSQASHVILTMKISKCHLFTKMVKWNLSLKK